MFKNHIYKIIWAYHNPYTYSYTALIKAKNPAHAQQKLVRKHSYNIHLIELTEVA